MASATQFFQYWALAFVTLCIALVLLSFFFQFVGCDLDLHGVRKEIAIAAFASAAQGAGFWFSASLFPGNPFKPLIVPGIMVAIIYLLAHFEDWTGYEVGGIAYFQLALLSTGLLLFRGDVNMAFLILGLFVFGLVIIAGIAKSL